MVIIIATKMANSTQSEKIPVETRAALVQSVDILVGEGYRKGVAFSKVGIEPYQYYRWKSDVQSEQSSPPTQEAS
jgi:hypothetical protein